MQLEQFVDPAAKVLEGMKGYKALEDVICQAEKWMMWTWL